MRGGVATLGVLATVWAVVSGCQFNVGLGSKPTVAKDALQKDIADRLTRAGERFDSVACQGDLVGEVGKTARCEVVMSETNSFEPVVTVTSVEGSTIDYDLAPAVSKAQLEKAVWRLVGDASGARVDSVSCESGLAGEVGTMAYCDVDAGGVTLRRTVVVNTVEGLMMNFDVVPVLTKREVENSLLDDLQTQAGQRPDSASCDDNLEGRPGETVDCTVISGQATRSFVLTVTTIDGNKINYSYAPRP
jgi:hypothetical protein